MKKLKQLSAVLFIAAFLSLGFTLSANVDENFVNLVTVDKTIVKIPVSLVNKIKSRFAPSELPNWSQLSPEKDGYEGTRTLELYDYIKTLGLEPKPLVVAVMDSGFEMDHPDLKDNVWNNDAEINGKPGVDDDGNGYVDDFHGWNFLGNAVALKPRSYKRILKTEKGRR